MNQSTPLDSLDSSENSADEERVKRILAEMNGDQRIISEPPVSTSIGDMRMDPNAARAHVIGNSVPSMADFQSMLFQTSPGMVPIHRNNDQVQAQPRKEEVKTTKSVWSTIVNHVRAPIMVAAIVFFLNLPVITNLMSRYASWMYLGSGEISIAGLFIKALLAGALFTVYQVIAAVFETKTT